MLQWFMADPILAMMYILAIPATVILILQTILLLFGMGGEDGDFDSDTSGIGDADAGDADGVRVGLHGGEPRSPLRRPNPEIQATIREILIKAGVQIR